MKNLIICALLSMLSATAFTAERNIQQECVLRSSWFADIVGLYNNPARQCTKQQVRLMIHEAANGGTKTINNCVQQTGYKIPSTVDSKRFESWGLSVTNNIFDKTMRDPNTNDTAMSQAFAEACMNNPDKFIGNQWFYR